MIWRGLQVFGLRLLLPVSRRSEFYGYPLRGILGRALFNAVCLYAGQGNDSGCVSCRLHSHCAYPLLFKPIEPQRLPPWWLHGWEDIEAGLRLDWYVLAAALPHLDAWLYGLQAHGHSAGWPDLRVFDIPSGVPVMQGRQRHLEALTPLSSETVVCPVLELQTLTPLISKHQGDPLYGPLRTRLQRLVQYYGDDSRLPIESNPWHCTIRTTRPVHIQLPRRVLMGQHLTLYLQEISPDAAELLQWGQYLHAGGHTSVGCGQYRLTATTVNPY